MTSDPKALLRQLGLLARKARGQNFLAADTAVAQVIDFADLQPHDCVLEVGAGLGVLSAELRRGVRVFRAVEIEETLCRHLRERVLSPQEVICADVRTLLLSELFPHERVVVVSNVPYSISSQFCEWLFDNHASVKRASLLLQREFAERLAADPGSRSYGTLSVFRKRFAAATLGPVLAGLLFYPPAKVDSRLIALDFFPEVQVPSTFRAVVRACFSQRRKTLLNSLSASHLGIGKDKALALLAAAEISPSVRAESLDLPDFLRLAECYDRVREG